MTEHETKMRNNEGRRGCAGATSAWDHVFVDAGSASCVLADRFSGSSSKRLFEERGVHTVTIVRSASDVAMVTMPTRKVTHIDDGDDRCAKVDTGLSTVVELLQATSEERW